MKHSAWYHKFWLTKLNDLPLKEDADTAWTDMQQILDQQLPAGHPPAGTPTPKPAGTTLSTYFGYILSAAAMVGVTTYIILRMPEQAKVSNTADTLRSDTVVTVKPLSDSTVSTSPTALAASSNQSDKFEQGFVVQKKAIINSRHYTGLTSNEAVKTGDRATILSIPALKDSTVPAASATSQANTATNASLPKKTTSQVQDHQLPADLSHNTGLATQHKEQHQKHIKKSPKVKMPINTPPYNYLAEAGINHTSHENTFYIGLSGSYALSSRWLIGTGLRLNTPRSFSGQYVHESYFRPDSLPAFSFTDSRKVLTMDVPLSIAYKLSNTISIAAGPVISLPLKQLGIKLGPINLKTDTLMHTKAVYDILNNTKMNGINIGFRTGISLHLSQFDINVSYQTLSPYKFTNEFGNHKFRHRNLQIGIGYRFK